jgi:ubiquitin C
MKVNIRTLEGRSFSVDVERDETVAQLKAKVTAAENIAVDRQRLIFSARELQDDRKLGDYNVLTDAVMHLVVRQETADSTQQQSEVDQVMHFRAICWNACFT